MSAKTKRLFAVVLILLLLPWLWLIAERLRGEWQFAAWTRAMQARGEKLTLDDLLEEQTLPERVTLLAPADLEALLGGLSSARETAPPLGRITGPGRAIAFAPRTVWLGADARERGWADYAQNTAGDRERLPAIRLRLRNETLRARLDYRQGFDLQLPHLARLKGAAQAFAYETAYDLHRGDHAGALANLQASAELIELGLDEGFLISQLVRIAVGGVALDAVWEALQSDGWSDPQLALLQADWERLRYLAPLAEALRFERASAAMLFPGGSHSSRRQVGQLVRFGVAGDSWSRRSGSSSFAWLANLGAWIDPLVNLARAELWRHVWARHDQLLHHRTLQADIDWAREHAARRDCRGLDELDAAEQEAWTLASDQFLLSRSALAVFPKALEKAALAETWREIAVAAIALERFHLRHGEWPASLDALAPDFVEAVPRDWMDGQPLRYRRDPDHGFLLYSVGRDGRDDGGDARPADGQTTTGWQVGRDLVWPRAATPEEIAAYEAELVGGQTGAMRRGRPGRGRP